MPELRLSRARASAKVSSHCEPDRGGDHRGGDAAEEIGQLRVALGWPVTAEGVLFGNDQPQRVWHSDHRDRIDETQVTGVAPSLLGLPPGDENMARVERRG